MPVPSNRTPVRLARGDYSALSTNLSSLGEGELVFAKDEDRLYMVEGGILVPCTTDISDKADLINGKLDPAQLPSLAISEYMGEAADEAAMIAFVGERGDWCVRTDLGATFILSTDDPTIATNWVQISSPEPVIPVDSVNGETGAVSLGIQDMDDFELNEDTSAITIYTFDADSTDPGAESGKINSYKVSGFLYISTTTKTGDAMPTPWPSLTFYWRYAGDPTWTQTSADSASIQTGSGRTFFALQRSGGEPTWPDKVAQEVELAFQDPGVIQYENLAEGDILKWNNTDQKFNPAQLATVATSGSYNDLTDQPTIPAPAPVDSVNGETGAVSLGIQEMDDFELYTEPAPSFAWDYGDNNTAGFASGGTIPQVALFVNRTDKDGNTFDDQAINATGTIYASSDASNWISTSYTLRGDFTNETRVCLETNAHTTVGFDGSGDVIYISIGNDPGQPVDVDLAEGDILQWVAADQKFKPSQLATVATSGSYNDLADQPTIPAPAPVDSVNGETGVVSLGVQGMDDFGLIEPTQDYTVVYNENPDAQGEARLIESGGGTPGVLGQVVLYVSDSNGESITSKVLALPATGSIKISSDNSTFYDYPYIAISAQRADGFDALPDYSNAVRLTFGGTERPLADTLGLATTYTGPLYTQLGPDPLQNGDILRWNDTDSKFKPAQLATVATSGSYNDLADQPTIPTAIDGLSDVDTTTASPTDGQVLTWVNANSQWEPVDAAGATVINDLTDVDTATAAPTDGQVLTWVNTNSQWEPGDLQGASIRAALGIGEYADDAAAGTGGVASGAMYYNTTSSDYRLKS